MRVLVDENLNESQNYVLTAQKPNHVLDCIKMSMARMLREMIFSALFLQDSTCSTVSRLWGLQDKNDMDQLESVKRRATKKIRRMKHTYKERLRQLEFPNLEKTRPQGHFIVFFQYLKVWGNPKRE